MKKATLGFPNVAFRLCFSSVFNVGLEEDGSPDSNQRADEGIQNSLNRIGGIFVLPHIKEND